MAHWIITALSVILTIASILFIRVVFMNIVAIILFNIIPYLYWTITNLVEDIGSLWGILTSSLTWIVSGSASIILSEKRVSRRSYKTSS